MASPLGLAASAGRPEGRRGPLTVAQEQLWALDRQAPPPGVLNLSYAVAVEGPLDVAALSGAFADLVRRHEPLRTSYAADDGTPVAEVGAEDAEPSGIDLTPSPVRDLEEAATLARLERETGFDTAREAPIRASLLRVAAERHVLLLTLHHVAADGWSLQLLSQELSRNYAARLRGEDAAPSPSHAECIEHALWQRDWLRSPAAERELGWWLDRLRGVSTRPTAPGTQARAASSEMLRQAVVIPDGLTAALRRLGREAAASVFVLLLTAFEVVVARRSESTEAVVGTLVANRPTPDSARVLGAHYNVLLLDADLGGDPTLAECILRASRTAVTALDHQALPYPVLAGRLERELGWDSRRMPAAMLLLDRYPLDELRLEGCRVSGLYLDGGPVARIDAATAAELTFFVREVGDRLTLSALYPSGSVEDGEVVGLMRGYLEILTAMTELPELPLSELTLPFDAPAPRAAADAASRPGLHEVSLVAPVEALSPVGGWTVAPN